MLKRNKTLAGAAAACAIVAFAFLATKADAACPASPVAACRGAGVTQLKIRAEGGPNDRLTWKWTRGTSTQLPDFGDPLSTATYSLCAWDTAGPLLDVEITPGGTCGNSPCWKAKGATGYRYNDPAASAGGVRSMQIKSGKRAKIVVALRGAIAPALSLPLAPAVTVQLLRDDAVVCFESIGSLGDVRQNTTTKARLKTRLAVTTPIPALPSAGCGSPLALYSPGTSTPDQLTHGALARTFRVYVPTSYDSDTPLPVVILSHGGFGSGAQIESGARIVEVAEDEGFIAISPDGVLSPAGIRTWNAGECCGYAMTENIDDVGFIAAILDRVESNACIDRRRVYATGMSNGAMLTHRLGCDLADRIRAIGPVGGTEMATTCAPARPLPVMHVHGELDDFVPYLGGFGCGVAGVPFTSVPETITRWSDRAGCRDDAEVTGIEGDGTCSGQKKCPHGNDVELCLIAGGGHVWPGGTPPVLPGIGSCLFGYQSQSFIATRVLWDYFAAHPPR